MWRACCWSAERYAGAGGRGTVKGEVFSMFRRFISGGVALLLSASAGLAQTSLYSSMSVAGTFQNWNPAHNNMALVSNNMWEAVLFIAQTNSIDFKFAANGGWAFNWGVGGSDRTFQGSVPTNGIAIGSGNIYITNLTDGFYLFRFNSSTKAFSVTNIGATYQGPLGDGNLLINGSFDLADPAITNEAYGWKWRPQMPYGDRFGNSGRVDWRYRSPESEMFVGSGSGGGIWQDVAGGEDFDYEFSAWFWMDGTNDPAYGPWTAAVQEIKFEFYNGARTKVGSDVVAKIPFFYSDEFKQTSVRAAAPAGTAWARVVLNVSGSGSKGSLQFDDLEVRAIPRSYQYFTSWNFTNVGTLVRGGWVATNAFIVTNVNGVVTNEGGSASASDLAYVGRSLALKSGGAIRSPYIEGGLNRIEFRYRNGNTNDLEDADPPAPISIKIRTSPDGISFGDVGEITDVSQQSYVLHSLSLSDFGNDQHYFEIVSFSGTNLLVLDNIEVLAPAPAPERGQTFGTWTNAAYQVNGCHELASWKLCTGRVFTAGAFVAPSALLPGRSNGFNYIQSPLLEGGYGDITFVAARGTNGVLPVRVVIQESANGITWTNVATLEPISNTGWTEQQVPLYQTESRYLRILNVTTGTPPGGAVTLIDEGFDAGATAPPGWTFKSIGTYETAQNSGRAIPGLKFDATGDFVETPLLSNPTNVQFILKGNSINAASVFRVEALISGVYQVVTNISGMTDTWRTNRITLTTSTTRLKFTYANKAGGNFAFDDVIVRSAPLPGQPPQDLMIDEINIRFPSADVVRYQDFESWPTKSQYASGVSEYQGWTVENAIINKDNAPPDGGQVLRLNSAVNNFIVSPPMYGGVGAISFKYAKWLSDTSPTMAVQFSKDNGMNWTTLTNLVITNSSANGYQNFEYLMNTNATVLIRLLHTAGVGRALIDDIFVDIPRPSVDVALYGWHDPAAPFTNDVVTLYATALPMYGANITNVVAYYRVGTNGAFSTLPMEFFNYVNYRTTSTNFGPFAKGTLVQYFIRADFTGPGASSPRYYPAAGSNAPAYFGVPRTDAGQVWINEIKFDDFFGDFFIELAGPTNFDISRWSIELYRINPPATNASEIGQLYGYYAISNNARLSTTGPDLGFWTLGTSSVPYSFDMAFTNETIWAYFPVGVVLRNDGGAIEQALSFNGTMRGFDRVPAEDWFNDGSLSLVGSGTNYAGFAWTNETLYTIGQMNQGQDYESDSPGAPDAWISRLIWSTNVTIVVEGNTNAWTVTPEYATQLSSPQTWSAVTPFNSSYANGTNTIWFARPTTNLYFLRVKLEE